MQPMGVENIWEIVARQPYMSERREHSLRLVAVSDLLVQSFRHDPLGLFEDDEQHVEEEVEDHEQSDLVEETCRKQTICDSLPERVE